MSPAKTTLLALLQIDPTVGDLQGNARLIADAAREAARLGANLAVTPELALVGYLPRDLLLSPDFVRRSWERVAELAREFPDGIGYEFRHDTTAFVRVSIALVFFINHMTIIWRLRMWSSSI